jgi:hypothetical protein
MENAGLVGRRYTPSEMGEMVVKLVHAAYDDGLWFMAAAGSLEAAFEPHDEFLRDTLGYPRERWPDSESLLAAYQLGVVLFAVEIDLIKAMRLTLRVRQAQKRRWFRRG